MIGNFVKSKVVTAYPHTPIREVARLMHEKRVGLVVLVSPDEADRVVGVVSERDVVRAVAREVDPDTPCDLIATKNVITLDYGESVGKAAEVFKKYGIRHIVVTKGEKLYGVLSIRDVIRDEAILRELAQYYDWTFERGMSA